ncbi:hypothetical protein STENM327S_05261 [Streptomyces tendae]
MNALNSLMDGFCTALTPLNLLWAALGVLLGTAIGVLPGIGPAMAVALLLPVTYGLYLVAAFIMFAGIYYGDVRRFDHLHPAEHPRRERRRGRGHGGQPHGQGGGAAHRRWRPRPSGAFAGGMIGTILLGGARSDGRRPGGGHRCAGLLRHHGAWRSSPCHRSGCLGSGGRRGRYGKVHGMHALAGHWN